MITTDFAAVEEWYEDDYLEHIGMPRRSGRYPWGSGKESYQRTKDFIARIDNLKAQGMSEKEIATAFGLTTTKFRIQQSMAKAERRAKLVDRATSLKERGYSNPEIANIMGLAGESSVRSLFSEKSAQKMNEAVNVANTIKNHIDDKGMIDVGSGIERELGTTREKMEQALYMLEMQGYPTYTGGMDQVTNPGKRTTIKVACPPGTDHKDIYDYSKIHTIKDYNTLTGESTVKPVFRYPTSIDGKRIHIRYAEDGGIDLDGTIEFKRNTPDLDLGNSRYAQVRVLVDNALYLKGMAVYKDDDNFPEGTDIVFNTNKKRGTPPEKVFKDIQKNLKDNPNNPFGSTIAINGQSEYKDPKTGKMMLSPVNKRADEGDWSQWSNVLSPQFLSKQNTALIKRQLTLTKADKQAELDDILSIQNPTVRKNLLMSFADDADGAAVHLKAAALPRMKFQVILPEPSLKDNEIYAPNFKDGEIVSLVRFPHGGQFEIPTLRVNNKNPNGKKTIGSNPKDAVCINSNVAERLSGADFDGDTVLVLPHNSKYQISTRPPLEGLKDFNNKAEFPARPGMKIMTKGAEGREMGVVSNLITDMTLRGADDDELARAVRHSMVVIDAKKHMLDYKKSEEVNGIQALKEKYQYSELPDGTIKVGGSSTLLSRTKSRVEVEKKVGTPKINMKDKPWYDPNEAEGSLIYNRVKNTKGSPDYDPSMPEDAYVYRKPKLSYRGKVLTEGSKRMAEAKDARDLMSSPKPTEQEMYYAEYANSMKALANEARKAYMNTPRLESNTVAKDTYASEVASLKAKLNTALLNKPKERLAQMAVNSVMSEIKKANPDMEKEQLKKIKTQKINEARERYGVGKELVSVTDREWEAIEKGAISDNMLTKILNNADIDVIRKKAMPKDVRTLTDVQLNLLKTMQNAGYSNDAIAERLGISTSMVVKY